MFKRVFFLSSTNRFILIVSLIMLLLGVTSLLYFKSQNFDFENFNKNSQIDTLYSQKLDRSVKQLSAIQFSFNKYYRSNTLELYKELETNVKMARVMVQELHDQIHEKDEFYKSDIQILKKLFTDYDSTIKHLDVNTKRIFYLNQYASKFSIKPFQGGKQFKQDLDNELLKTENHLPLFNAKLRNRSEQLKDSPMVTYDEYYHFWTEYLRFLNNQKYINFQNFQGVFEMFHNFTEGLKTVERNAYKTSMRNERASFVDSILAFELTARGLIVIIFVLSLIVIINIKKLYSDESKIIEYGKTVEEYAAYNREFLANMSHELRTPINSIIGFLEQLEQTELNPQQLEHLGYITASSEMLLGTVNDILDFSKFETNKVELIDQPFSPYNLINQVASTIKIQAQKKHIELKINSDFDANLYLIADPFRVKQLILNLLSNAIKYTPNEGKVTLNAHITDKVNGFAEFTCAIIDTGIGISPVNQIHIFDKFIQVSSRENSEWQNGTGLGLAICKNIVQLFGGDITVKSALGQGSTFSFNIVLPIVKDIDVIENEVKIKTAPLHNVAYSNIRILFVDDNEMNVRLGLMILKKYGFQYDVAYNGAEAFEKINQNEYDVIISDIQMPVLDGIQLAKKVRELPNEKADTKILGLTANVLQEDIKRYLSVGMNVVITKPYTEALLIEKIKELINPL